MPFLQLTESQTARHMAVLVVKAAMGTTKSTGQSPLQAGEACAELCSDVLC